MRIGEDYKSLYLILGMYIFIGLGFRLVKKKIIVRENANDTVFRVVWVFPSLVSISRPRREARLGRDLETRAGKTHTTRKTVPFAYRGAFQKFPEFRSYFVILHRINIKFSL